METYIFALQYIVHNQPLIQYGDADSLKALIDKEYRKYTESKFYPAGSNYPDIDGMKAYLTRKTVTAEKLEFVPSSQFRLQGVDLEPDVEAVLLFDLEDVPYYIILHKGKYKVDSKQFEVLADAISELQQFINDNF